MKKYSKWIVALSCSMIILGGIVEMLLCWYSSTTPSDVFWGLWFAAWEGELWALCSIKKTEVKTITDIYDKLSAQDKPNKSDMED